MAPLTRKTDRKGRVTLPADFADSFVLIERRGEDELVLRKAKLLPQRKRKYRLNDLLKGVTEDNLHGEVDLGPPAGKELL